MSMRQNQTIISVRKHSKLNISNTNPIKNRWVGGGGGVVNRSCFTSVTCMPMMVLMVMVKLITSKYRKRYKRDTERLSDYDSGIETDPDELSVSQTWRSDQPIHGGYHQTFEMKKLLSIPL